MPLLAVHGDFTSHAEGVHLKQKLEMSRTVAVGEIELVGYQITFDSKNQSANVPDQASVQYRLIEYSFLISRLLSRPLPTT